MDRIRLFRLWCGFSVFAAAAIVFSVMFLDGPVANFSKREVHMPVLVTYAPSSIHITIILAAICGIVGLFCILIKRLPNWAEAILLSAVAAAASLCLTALLFKPLFARPNPQLFVYHLRNNFGWHSPGLASSAFPSTHAALAAAGLLVLGLYFAAGRIACIFCLFAIDAMLVIGGWHFISDVLAGNLVGVTIAALGCETASVLRPRQS
jgi:membrane-associated phospholipid phosphatase